MKSVYDERRDMAKKCVDKENEMTDVRRMFEECEQKNSLLEERVEELIKETLKLKDQLEE